MTNSSKADFQESLVKLIRKSGYSVTSEPTRTPNWKFWQEFWTTLMGVSKHRPGILVERGDDFLLVEAKTGPVLLGSVIQARNYADHYGADVVLCVPDESFSEIPSSVLDFADDNEIRLCSESQIGEAIKSVFE